MREYQREWRGVAFRDLPQGATSGSGADHEFYQSYYSALASKAAKPDPSWLASKIRMGEWVEQTILRRHRAPRVISIGAGEAFGERIWLRLGYDVTLNECQQITLEAAKAEFPEVRTVIGDASRLELEGKFDVITMFAIDYAFLDSLLKSIFQNLSSSLTGKGELLNNTVNALTIVQLLKEMVKLIVRKSYDAPGYVVWGWRRTPGAVIRLAAEAGLELHEQWVVTEGRFVQRHPLLWRWPTWRHPNIVMIFRKHRNVGDIEAASAPNSA